jgi:hypothetical protein
VLTVEAEFVGVFDIFSKRQKKLRGEVPDVYTYDDIPQPLRVQIIHIWNDTLGSQRAYADSHPGTRRAYRLIVETLCREYGVFLLGAKETYGERNYLLELGNFLLAERDPEKALDVIELSFRVIDRMTRTWDPHAPERADEAILEWPFSRTAQYPGSRRPDCEKQTRRPRPRHSGRASAEAPRGVCASYDRLNNRFSGRG